MENENDFVIELSDENTKLFAKVEEGFKSWISIEESYSAKIVNSQKEFDKKFELWIKWH